MYLTCINSKCNNMSVKPKCCGRYQYCVYHYNNLAFYMRKCPICFTKQFNYVDKSNNIFNDNSNKTCEFISVLYFTSMSIITLTLLLT